MRDRALQAARAAKHAAWLLSIEAKTAPKRAAAKVRDPLTAFGSRGRTYVYEPGEFRRSFLDWNVPDAPVNPAPITRRIVAFWTGDNPLSQARERSLDSMRTRLGVPVTLVSPDNLAAFVVPEHPLHAAYENLSLVHRADYLRAYFMHHHGGGYCDLKTPSGAWTAVFERMDHTSGVWITGYPEHSSVWIAQAPGHLGRTLKRWHSTLPGGGAFVVRPGTALSAEWLAEIERRLDYFGDLLAAHPGGVRGEDPSYPISWNRLLAQVLHPLCLKHHRHVAVDPVLKPVLSDYR